MKMTELLSAYLKERRMDLEWIAKQTGIPARKLSYPPKEPLNAEELLRLCSYLHVKPEQFWEETKGDEEA